MRGMPSLAVKAARISASDTGANLLALSCKEGNNKFDENNETSSRSARTALAVCIKIMLIQSGLRNKSNKELSCPPSNNRKDLVTFSAIIKKFKGTQGKGTESDVNQFIRSLYINM